MSHSNDHRNFIIFNVSELDIIEFGEVLESSVSTIRKSVDETKALVKWEGDTPAFVSLLTNTEGPYTYQEVVPILSTTEWTYNP